MQILQWNIWYKEDINNIAKELRRINADVVCIQELSFSGDDRTTVKVLNEIYPYIYYEIADTFLDIMKNDYNSIKEIQEKYK